MGLAFAAPPFTGRPKLDHAHGLRARNHAGPARFSGPRRRRFPAAVVAAAARVPRSRHPDRSACIGPPARHAADPLPRRVRGCLPDVLDRAGVLVAAAAVDAAHRVRARRCAGRADNWDHPCNRLAARTALRRRSRGHLRAGCGACDVVDCDRNEDDLRALATRHRARQADRWRTAVSGSCGRPAACADPCTVGRSVRARPHARPRNAQGGCTAGDPAGRRPAGAALVAAPGRTAQVARAVHAERAARDAGARLDDRGSGAFLSARRIRGGDADRRDRIPSSGRRRHQALPRRASGSISSSRSECCSTRVLCWTTSDGWRWR